MTSDSDVRLLEAPDRPAGSRHPRSREVVYPLDYGHLEGTTSGDRDGIDVWAGSAEERRVVAIACTVDLLKRDLELKILLSSTKAEAERVLEFHNTEKVQACLIRRPLPSSTERQGMDPR